MQDDEMRSQETAHDEQTAMGAQVNMAVNLLNNFMREIDDNDLFIKVAQLKTLAERGVISIHCQAFCNEFKGIYAVWVEKHV